ncbi:MAG: hypothetical protein IMF19_12040 [Proteobacteria bacterium]|nr:hypothetical protein [Pseudomonadota bacterium]
MTFIQRNIQIAIEAINNELASLQFDIDHKHHSAMELFDLLSHMDKLKSEKAKLEAKLKAI